MDQIVKYDKVENKVLEVRGAKAILDSDLAELYGVETKRINEAVKNNPEKFPAGYLIELTREEWAAMKSKFSSSKRGGKVKLPTAFTEKGLYMLATILKSPAAVQTTIAIIETFTKLRELARNVKALASTQDKNAQQGLMQKSGEMIASMLDDDLQKAGSETTIEINFAVLKFKHVIKKKNK
jgi:hypothetical protein